MPVLLGSISSAEKQRDKGGREREDKGMPWENSGLDADGS